MGRIIITGDIHGNLSRLWNLQFKYNLTEEDVVIITGDCGLVWEKTLTRKNIRKLSRTIKAKVLFVDGNHENFDLIYSYPIVDMFGGKVHMISEQLIHLIRGEVYCILGHTFFCFGGAYSIDRYDRVLHKSLWEEEVPTQEEILYGNDNLEKHLDEIEYVITHEAPAIVRKYILSYHSTEFGEPITYKLPSIFDRWLERLMFDSSSFQWWFCGHHHQDRDMSRQGFPCSILYHSEEVII